MIHALHQFWDYIGGNVTATPFCGALAGVGAVLFRKPVAAWWHKHFGVKADLADIKAVADAAHEAVKSVLTVLEKNHQETHRRLDEHAQELATIKATAPGSGT